MGSHVQRPSRGAPRYSSKVAKAVPYEVVHIQINDEVIAARSATGVLSICEGRSSELNAVNIATAVHRIARRASVDEVFASPTLPRLLDAHLEPWRREAPAADALEIASTVWSLARLLFSDATLLDAISSAALRKLRLFCPRWLSKIAWADAPLMYVDSPLRDAIASASLATRQLDLSDLACTAWSFAKRAFVYLPLLDALSA